MPDLRPERGKKERKKGRWEDGTAHEFFFSLSLRLHEKFFLHRKQVEVRCVTSILRSIMLSLISLPSSLVLTSTTHAPVVRARAAPAMIGEGPQVHARVASLSRPAAFASFASLHRAMRRTSSPRTSRARS